MTTRQPTAHYHRSQQQELAPVFGPGFIFYIFGVISDLNRIIIIIRSRRQQRSVASNQSDHVDEPWTIRHEC